MLGSAGPGGGVCASVSRLFQHNLGAGARDCAANLEGRKVPTAPVVDVVPQRNIGVERTGKGWWCWTGNLLTGGGTSCGQQVPLLSIDSAWR